MALFEKVVLAILPPVCYEEFFIKFNYFHVECLKLAVSKGLGFAIILGSILVKVPQILKLLQAGSAQGINFFSVLMELAATTISVSYSLANGFPFSAWGECLFILIQVTIIASLVVLYSYGRSQMMIFIPAFGCIVAFLVSAYAPSSLLAVLQTVNLPIIVMSKLIQALENYKNANTGQLSALTVMLTLGGSVARIFTSIQETGDSLIIVTYACSSVANGILAGQMVYYWNKPVEGDSKKSD